MEAAEPNHNPQGLIVEIPTEGTLGFLTKKEEECLNELKDHIKKKGQEDPKWDDWYLLRFCRARKFKIKDVIIMWDNFIDFRKEKKVDTMIGDKDFSDIKEYSKDGYHHGYYGVSRDGLPVYIEEYASVNVDELLKKFSEDHLKDYYTNSFELMLHSIFPEASKLAGRRIDRMITILDVKGVGIMRMMKSDMRSFLKMAASVSQDNYPESMGRLFIVNAGWSFTGLWKVVKQFLDEKTNKKIKILGDKFEKDLHKVVDPAQLPEFLGGTCKDSLMERKCPWFDYEQQCYEQKTYFPDGIVQGDPWKETARKQKQG